MTASNDNRARTRAERHARAVAKRAATAALDARVTASARAWLDARAALDERATTAQAWLAEHVATPVGSGRVIRVDEATGRAHVVLDARPHQCPATVSLANLRLVT